jgi:hypothetical protein
MIKCHLKGTTKYRCQQTGYEVLGEVHTRSGNDITAPTVQFFALGEMLATNL